MRDRRAAEIPAPAPLLLQSAPSPRPVAMDHIARIRRHFTESANLKLSSVESLAPQIVRAAEVMTQCLLGRSEERRVGKEC